MWSSMSCMMNFDISSVDASSLSDTEHFAKSSAVFINVTQANPFKVEMILLHELSKQVQIEALCESKVIVFFPSLVFVTPVDDGL